MTSPVEDEAQVDDLVTGFRSFLRAEVVSRHQAMEAEGGDDGMYGADGRFRAEVLDAMREVREASAKAGFYDMFVPADLGGGGAGMEVFYRIWEAAFHLCGSKYWLGYHAVAHWARGPSHLFALASERVRESAMPGLSSGTQTMCFAMSEPDAGSDAWMMRTTAQPDGNGGYHLSGQKQWITNAPYADFAVVFAVTDRGLAGARKGGITAFFTPTDAPGFRVERVIKMFGHDGGDEGVIALEDVHVGADQVIGEVGDGFGLALQGVSMGRMYNSARSVGLARWAMETALAYAGERVTFGRPIIDNQAVSFPLADSAMEIHAARLMGIDCARKLDRGAPVVKELSMTKAFSTEMAVRALDRAMQIHGASGFTNELGLGEAWQQARRICVADGSAEMMRRQIVRQLVRGNVDF